MDTPDSSPSCKIGIIADSHIGISHDGGWNQPIWRGREGEEILFSRLREWRIQNQVDFIIHCGDIAEPHAIRRGVNLLNSLGCPVASVRGNHDITQPAHYTDWSKNVPRAANLHFADSVYENEFCDVVLLNNQWIDRQGKPQWHWETAPVGWMNDQQLVWLDGVLGQRNDRPAIVVMHYPLDIIPPYPISEAGRKAHEEYCQKVNEILDRHERVKLVASGHFHCTTNPVTPSGRMHLTTAAFTEAPFQVRLVEIYSDRMTIETHQLHQPGDPVSPRPERRHLNGDNLTHTVVLD